MWLIIIVLISSISVSTEASNFNVEICFAESDFEIITNSNKQIQINVLPNSSKEYWFPGENLPAILLFSYNYGISGNYDLKELKVVSVDSHLIASDVGILKSLPCVPTNMDTSNNISDLSGYYESDYPTSPVSNNGISHWNNLSIFYLTITPFEYDAKTRRLYFISRISIELEISDIAANNINKRNCPDYAMFTISNSNFNVKSNLQTNTNTMNGEKIDYLIITNEELKNEFIPLLKWKKRKGLSTQIVTTDEISKIYPDQSIQMPLKIKKFLYDKYMNNQLEYVLLGGDDKIVPVMKCYCKANYREHVDMPVDLFYSCFEGAFDWDGNNNGIYGEEDDDVNLASSIFVSRIPVRSHESLSQYIKKLLEYEMSPRWNDNILMAGCQLSVNYKSGQSDAEAQSCMLYDSIQPLWAGQRFQLFDTASDFGDERFSKESLKNQLSKGYGYVDVITHGSQCYWITQNGNYDCQDGESQVNSSHSIILTSACNTNAFDCPYDIPYRDYNKDPCLSESLIRNYNSGVVAYWGSSRENWTNGWENGSLDHSLVMEVPFYKGLFGDKISNKNFAKLVAYAKSCNIGRAYVDPTYRWLQYSLNPIGDPEMSLYSTTPLEFDKFRCYYTNKSVIFDAGVEDCKICIMSKNDDGESCFKVFDHVRTVEISDLPDVVSVCITKQNFIPKLLTITYLHDITLDSDTHIVSDIVRIGKNANPTRKSGDVNIICGHIVIDAKEIEVGDGVNISKGATVEFNNKYHD